MTFRFSPQKTPATYFFAAGVFLINLTLLPLLSRFPILSGMIINVTTLALQRLVTPQFRSMLWKSFGGTLFLLVLIWFGIREVFSSSIWPWLADFLPGFPNWFGWFGVITTIVLGFGLAAVLAFLIAPITALIGSFFMDEVAEIIEKEDYPADKAGKAIPLGRSLIIACRFLILSLIGNLVVLLLWLFVPGINLIAFLAINGYLLGREYFEFAAARLRTEKQAHRFYQKNAFTVFLAGLVIALFLAIPLLNLLTPLFAAAIMTHLHKQLSKSKNGQ